MSLTHDNAPTASVDELDEQAGRDLFERSCRDRLGVAADEFLAAYDSGNLHPAWSMRDVVELEMLLPFVR